MREYAEHFMEKYGESWKSESVVVEKMKALRSYMIEELSKIDDQEEQEERERQENRITDS